MNADSDIKLLNGLIAATMDSARHYRKVAAHIGHPRIRALFEHLSVQRKLVAKELQDQLMAIAGNPQGESITGAHRVQVFGNLRHVMDYGYCALIDEVERCEERIKAKYERALRDDHLSRLTRALLERAYSAVREGGADMHALKRYPQAEEGRSQQLQQW